MPDTPNRPPAQNKYPEQYMGNSSFDETFAVNTVEPLGFDGVNLQRLNASNLALQLHYDGSSNPIYIGIAKPGTATSAAFWQIRKLTFDGGNNVTSIKYASGSPDFNQIWDDRAGLSYS